MESGQAFFIQRTGVTTTLVDERVVLYDVRSRQSIVLNPTGSLLWSALEHPQTMEQLATLLVGRYAGLALEQARADVDVYLKELTRLALIEPSGVGASL